MSYTVSRVTNPKPTGCREVLSMEELDGILAGSDTTVLLLYMPWCPPCKEFHPKFEAAELPIQSVTVNQELLSHPDMQVKAWPEVWLCHGGKLSMLPVENRDERGILEALRGAGAC
jgi:thiol-disulfide isomerase/thioredoxin